MQSSNPTPGASRRDFLKTSAATAVSATLAAAPAVHAAGGDVLRVGLVGCGGRGTGAGAQAAKAGSNIKIVALADMFKDRLDRCHGILKKELGERFAVTPDRCFTGFDGYKQLIASGVDVVLLATPPHFRPAHLKASVEAGKHTFVEKPVAVDGPGVRSILESAALAKKKGLCIVSGLCYRYDTPKRETIKRIHDGAVGDIVALQCNYNTGGLWVRNRKPEWSDMEWQLRNWLYFSWLSGDHNVEQHIHSLDKMAWAMKDQYPVKAVGLGGRQVRTDPKFGHIFDHHAVVYEFAGGVKCFSFCRQQSGAARDVSDHIMGTKGKCEMMRHTISGETTWRFKGRYESMYQNEHNELFAAIRSGTPINNGEYMAKSTLMAIMGRMATYTGKVINWDDALNSDYDLTPASYEFGPLEVPEVAKPGITKKA